MKKLIKDMTTDELWHWAMWSYLMKSNPFKDLKKMTKKPTKSQLRRKNIQTGGARVPIPRPGGPMKDKKKYDRRTKHK